MTTHTQAHHPPPSAFLPCQTELTIPSPPKPSHSPPRRYPSHPLISPTLTHLTPHLISTSTLKTLHTHPPPLRTPLVHSTVTHPAQPRSATLSRPPQHTSGTLYHTLSHPTPHTVASPHTPTSPHTTTPPHTPAPPHTHAPASIRFQFRAVIIG